MTELTVVNSAVSTTDIKVPEEQEQFLTINIGSQLFGIPVVKVRDVLKPQQVTRIPLAKPQIQGFMNLRGRIVTVIDMRKRLALSPQDENDKRMFVVVEHEDELYSLIVDSVGDARNLPIDEFEKNPVNLDACWKEISRGVFKLDNKLMLVLDVSNVLNI